MWIGVCVYGPEAEFRLHHIVSVLAHRNFPVTTKMMSVMPAMVCIPKKRCRVLVCLRDNRCRRLQESGP